LQKTKPARFNFVPERNLGSRASLAVEAKRWETTMNFKEWSEKYYPNEPEDVLHKMSHAWASGHVNMAASVVLEPASQQSSGADRADAKSCPECETWWALGRNRACCVAGTARLEAQIS
jgi:hypothetical protein